MKRTCLAAFCVLIVFPMMSHAGNVSSRWDMSIGGHIKFDMGWADQGVNADYRRASRESTNTFEVREDKYSSIYAAGAETRMHWRIKGPDGLGAKTAGFVEADFRGVTRTSYGEFGLRHSYMTLDWEKTKLLIGHTWRPWGRVPTYSSFLLGYNDILPFTMGGLRLPQISLTQKLSKEFALTIGATYPTNPLGENKPNSYTLGMIPHFSADLTYKTDKCGKIGRWMTEFGISGVVGREKQTFDVSPGILDDDTVESWAFLVKGFVPIISQNKENKAGALGISFNIWTGQNVPVYLSDFPASYDRGNRRYVAPVITGGWSHLQYWLTNKISCNVGYGYAVSKLSDAYRQRNRNAVQKFQHLIFNVMYDVNPAIRFGIEYGNIYTRYADYPAGLTGERSGTINAARVGAYYFF